MTKTDAQEGFRRIAAMIAEGTQNMTTAEQPTQGHKFMAQAFLDGRGGAFTQVYQCECGKVYVATRKERKGRKEPVNVTVIDAPCPLTPPERGA